MSNTNAPTADEETKHKKWLVAQLPSGYCEHENMICNLDDRNWLVKALKGYEGTKPKSADFAQISIGDIIAHYDFMNGLIIGLFRVVTKEELEEMPENVQKIGEHEYLRDDFLWDDCIIRYVKPYVLHQEEKFLNFKKFLKNHDCNNQFTKKTRDYISNLDNISRLKNPTINCQKAICTQLSEEDYQIIKNFFSDTNMQYFEKPGWSSGSTSNTEVLTSLLDFYNSRTTSFANLFLASIFGVVALSAIVGVIPVNLTTNNIWANKHALISIIPYVFFVFMGYYTFDRYRNYADIAEKIKSNAFEYPNYTNLNKSKVSLTNKQKQMETIGLADFIHKKGRRQNRLFKWLRQRGSDLFVVFFFIALITLGFVVYWNLLRFLVHLI